MTVQIRQLAGIDTVTLSNALVDVVVLTGKGADIYSMRSTHSGVDPLWKARWGPEHMQSTLLANDSGVNWLARCPGGWQTLVPSGGIESVVQGAVQPQHGEASSVPWRLDGTEEGSTSSVVTLSCRLTRSPLCLRRTIELPNDEATVHIRDTATNEGGLAFPLTWTHHPTLGPPFLSGDCRISTNAMSVEIDDTYDLPHVPYRPPCVSGSDEASGSGLSRERCKWPDAL